MTTQAQAPLSGLGARLFWLVVFGAAFGYLEGAVVVYLRELYYPAGFGFPLAPISESLLPVELARELATLIMLASVAMAAARTAWGRFGVFSLLFGVWDLVFYAVLHAVLGWPESFMTWDILFLLPTVWVGPVLSAVLVAASLCLAGGIMFLRAERGFRPRTAWWVWGGAIVSLALLLYAFMADSGPAMAGAVPSQMRFPWIPYAAGVVLGWGMFAAAFGREAKTAISGPDRSTKIDQRAVRHEGS